MEAAKKKLDEDAAKFKADQDAAAKAKTDADAAKSKADQDAAAKSKADAVSVEKAKEDLARESADLERLQNAEYASYQVYQLARKAAREDFTNPELKEAIAKYYKAHELTWEASLRVEAAKKNLAKAEETPQGLQAPAPQATAVDSKAQAYTQETLVREKLPAGDVPSAGTESEDPLKITDPSDSSSHPSPERLARRDTPGDPRTIVSQRLPDAQDPGAASGDSHASISTETAPQTDDKPSGSTKASGADGKAQGGETPAKMDESATSDDPIKTKGTSDSESAPEKSSGGDAA
ncbi:hypothetical protein [Mycolicibacterium madagascariense]|uniref:hypothetical protein n=1 Tax=Mycolicibacterium madagascariense TaxID=212765 RepID=UPI0021F37FC6|nr:hypothetical protein [Mycolicibacterium madagascariense]MCV7014211.1 hypothetical protein [Mycolicibacterium madagascariense]